MASALNAKHFQNEDEARKTLEAILWPSGPVCPHCGVIDYAYARSKPGVYRCAEVKCKKDFTVTMKTVMERSHIPLHKWLQAFYLYTSSKKGFTAHQLHRTLKITYRSAWFMAHRIREAMRDGGLKPMGGGGEVIEADETYFGPIEKSQFRKKTTSGRPFTKGGRTGPSNKRAIVSLVQRGGSVRSFHVGVADQDTVQTIVSKNVAAEARLFTDESKLYFGAGDIFAEHETVRHSAKEYVRGEVHTNTIEGFFSIFKRGMKGNYQHCKEKHLHRYLAEFDFRYNNRIALGADDGERATRAVMGAAGKRLTYRQPH